MAERCPQCGEPVTGSDHACGACGASLPARPLLSFVVPLLVVVLVLGGVVWWVVDDPSRPTADAGSSSGRSPSSTGLTPPSTGQRGSTAAAPSSSPLGPIEGAPGPPGNPLAIEMRYVNQPCSAQYLLMIATAGLDQPNPPQEKLPVAAEGFPAAKYLHNRSSCPDSFRQTIPNGEIFQAYVGPFTTLEETCRVRWRVGRPATWPKRLASPTAVFCLCLEDAASLPTLRPGPLARSNQFRVSDVQQLLFTHSKKNEERRIDGTFDTALQRKLMSYQREMGVPATGMLDTRTWRTIQEDAC